jgi:hypothetical protein
MPTQLQIRRGTTTDHNTFTGAAGELTVDTTKDTLIVHDGSTEGGFELARADGSNLNNIPSNLTVNGTVTADGLTVDGNASIGSSGTSVLDFERSGANYIRANNSGTGRLHLGAGSDLRFHTGQADNEFSENERLRISSGGDISFYEDTGTTPKFFWDASAESLGLGTTTPNYLLDVEGSGDLFRINSTSGNSLLQFSVPDTTSITGINFGDAGSSNTGAIYYRHTGDSLAFTTNGTEAMRIDSSGHLIVPEGVTLGTAAGTYVAANTLDDYEEGTFTPVLTTDNSDMTVSSYTNQDGLYTKVGDLVTIAISLQIGGFTSVGTGSLSITGLPFTPSTAGNFIFYGSSTFSTNAGWVNTPDSMGVFGDANKFRLVKNNTTMTATDLGGGAIWVRGALTYKTA